MTNTTMPSRDAAPATVTEPRRHATPPHTVSGVRESDLEPYIGLRYLSKLFRLMALILVLLLIAEVIVGFQAQGTNAIPRLMEEGSRLIVFAGLLWGAGDLAILLIDMGHDVRAARILLARQLAHHMDVPHPGRPAAAATPADGHPPVSTAPAPATPAPAAR